MKIAIINPGGITNFGERAIMLGTIYTLREQYPEASIVIFGYQDLEKEDPDMFKELDKLNVQFYPLIIHGNSKISKLLRAIGVGIAPKLFLPRESYKFLKGAIAYSKGQETMTQNYGMMHFADSILEQLLVSRVADKVILYGHSVGPVYKYKRLTSWLIKRFDEIDVRDSRSKKALKELGYPPQKIKQIKDLAYAAVERYDFGKSDKKGHYLIVPNAAMCQEKDKEEQHMSNLRHVIKTLLEKKKPVVIGSSVTTTDWNNDYRLCEKLKKEFSELEIIYYTQLSEFLRDVKSAKKVISSRLHPLIMATGLGVDVLALSRSPKVIGLLGDLNLQSEVIDPFNELNPKELEAHL